MSEGTVVCTQEQADRWGISVGVVYKVLVDKTLGIREKRVRPLYEIVEKKQGHPERRWYRWIRDQEKKEGEDRFSCREIKALTSKKESPGGAVVDVEAHWRQYESGNIIGEEYQDFNGNRTVRELLIDKDRKPIRYQITNITRDGEQGKTTRRELVDIDLQRKPNKPWPIMKRVVNDKVLSESITDNLHREAIGALKRLRQRYGPDEIDFRHGDYYLQGQPKKS